MRLVVEHERDQIIRAMRGIGAEIPALVYKYAELPQNPSRYKSGGVISPPWVDQGLSASPEPTFISCLKSCVQRKNAWHWKMRSFGGIGRWLERPSQQMKGCVLVRAFRQRCGRTLFWCARRAMC